MGVIQRREREKVEMRQLIVDAAIEMYLKEGYDKLTLRSIAQRIEYAPGTIYLYFKDKSELFHAMHEWAFEQLYKKFTAVGAVENPLERLRLISYVYVEFAFDNPELYDLMFILNEPMCADANIDEWKCGQQVFGFLHSTVAQCLELGVISGGNADVLSFAFWSSAHGMISLNLRNRLKMYNVDKRQLIHAAMAAMFQSFVRPSNSSS